MVSSGNNRVARFIHGQCDIFFFLNCKNKAVVVSHGTGWDKTKASVHCKMTNIQIGQSKGAYFPEFLLIILSMRNSSKKTKTKRNKETHQKNLKTNVDAHTLATLGVNLYKSLQHDHICTMQPNTHNANMFCTFSCHFCRRKKSHVALTFEIFRIQDFCIKITDRAIIKFLQESDIDMKTRLIFY